MSTFLTLSSFVIPSTLFRYLISVACNLLACHFCTVQISDQYSSVGTTTALNTPILVHLLSSLLSWVSDFIAPITFDAAPILLSVSSSHVPSSLNNAPRYTSSPSLPQFFNTKNTYGVYKRLCIESPHPSHG